jgi:hypothetical protein
MAEARFITGSQLGSVMSVTSTSPSCTLADLRDVSITRTLPAPILEPMARPSASTSPRLPMR